MVKLLTSKTNLLIIGILLLAAFLRLYHIGDYMTFLGDEGRDALTVYNILHGHPTLLGPRSSAADFYYGPIYFYLIAPFLLLFNYDPVGPAIFIALIGIATVWLLYKVTKEIFGPTAGIVAASLYAISPVVIAYSRSSWNPNPLPFVSLLSLYLLSKAVIKPTSRAFLLVGILLGIAMQLQYLALFLVTIMVSYVFASYWYTYRKIQIVHLMHSYARMLGGFLIGFSPFLAFDILHGFPNSKTIIRFILFGNPGEVVVAKLSFIERIIDVFFRLFGRLVTNFPPPEQVALGAHPSYAMWYGATMLLGVVSVGILLVQLKKQKGEKFLSHLFVTWWLLGGILLFGFYKKSVYDYYLGFMFPLPFLLVGQAVSYLLKRQLIFKAITLVAFMLIVWINWSGMPFRSTPNRQKDQVKQIADFVLSKTDNKPFNFALLTLGNSDHAYRYFFKIAGKDPVEIISPQIDPQRTSVTDQLLIVCEDPNCQPLGAGLWEVAGFGRAEIVGKWDVSVVRVYKLKHYQGKISYE